MLDLSGAKAKGIQLQWLMENGNIELFSFFAVRSDFICETHGTSIN